MKRALLIVVLMLIGCGAPARSIPLIHAHAHNDYEHARPLVDALECGFRSVEADVHLVDGELLVAHDRKNVVPGRTLEKLYLDPLRKWVRRNKQPVTLLIDIKSQPAPTYAAIKRVLSKYDDLLTHFDDQRTVEGPITVILTGDKPRELIAAERERVVACDVVLADLDSNPPATFIPWISAKWSESFTWKGEGPMPAAERMKLRKLARRAHAQGRQLRFWGAPDNEATWRELRAADVDLINTDDLRGCRDFLLRQG